LRQEGARHQRMVSERVNINSARRFHRIDGERREGCTREYAV